MTEILTRVMGVLQRVRDMSELSGAATVVFIVIFVFGLLNCILGYRILRFWMMLFGFGMGAGAGLVAAFLSGVEGKSAYLMAMLILGVILAAISFMIYRAGIFILGAGIGMSLGIYILHPTTSAMFFLCILIGVGLGCLAMRYAREVIIVGTSLLGGVMAGFSLGKLGGLANIPYGLAMSVGFVALGILLQFVINKPEYEEDEEDGDEPEEGRKRKQEGICLRNFMIPMQTIMILMMRMRWIRKMIFWKKRRYISQKENRQNRKKDRIQEESFKMYEGENRRDV